MAARSRTPLGGSCIPGVRNQAFFQELILKDSSRHHLTGKSHEKKRVDLGAGRSVFPAKRLLLAEEESTVAAPLTRPAAVIDHPVGNKRVVAVLMEIISPYMDV